MLTSVRLVSAAGLFFLMAMVAAGQKNVEILVPVGYRPPKLEVSALLQKGLETDAAETLASLAGKGWKPDELSATVIDLRDASNWKMASIRGEEKIYPASVPKMFYMVALRDSWRTVR